MILKSVWCIAKGAKKSFSLVVHKWFHQMNTKLSWTESNDPSSCHSNFKSFVFFFYLPPRLKLEKEQRPEELWTGVNTVSLYRRHPQRDRLSGLELLVIRWQRTPSPGSTVKGGRNVLRALHAVRVCAWVGEGVSKLRGLQWKAAAIYRPRAQTFT